VLEYAGLNYGKGLGMGTGDNIRRFRKMRRMTQSELAEKLGLTEGAVRHYESGIRAVKPELLPQIAKALNVSQSALKDYQVESYTDLIGMFLQLEDIYGLQPAGDGMGLSLDPNAKHSPKLAFAFKEWAQKRQELADGEITPEEYADWKATF
jgi:transcriptional regulator with XRE-family HTH domain